MRQPLLVILCGYGLRAASLADLFGRDPRLISLGALDLAGPFHHDGQTPPVRSPGATSPHGNGESDTPTPAYREVE